MRVVVCVFLTGCLFFGTGLWTQASANGCSGDCATCHYKLDYKNDKRHKDMLSCKSCHTSESSAQDFENVGFAQGCGQDCFACHDVQKIRAPHLQKQHSVIDRCIKCHKGLASSVLRTPGANDLAKDLFKGDSLSDELFK